MAKKRDDVEVPKWVPNNNDVADLKLKLASYAQIRINGRWQSRFDQYCKTIGVLSFDEYGNIVVHQPNDYRNMSAIYWKLKSQEDGLNEAYLQTHPEERAALIDKIKHMGSELRLV